MINEIQSDDVVYVYWENWQYATQKESRMSIEIYVFNNEKEKQEYLENKIVLWKKNIDKNKFGDESWTYITLDKYGKVTYYQLIFLKGWYLVEMKGYRPNIISPEEFKLFFFKKVKAIEEKL